ncbi:5'-nucleotidase C-terminal domain-containing protein [Pontibacter arcticus]|uniref:5'-nucleotidase C-terminal domain-containing protein n=1 Tax=Pontibacter arcticus TaxID=2080288 RepID=UPI001EEFC374|nr:5'-nucleotidase C-terminal domain-containing protein [Pontibacter arcticus]
MPTILSKNTCLLLLGLAVAACQPRAWQSSATLTQTDVAIDSTIAPSPQTEALVAPYRQQVTTKMSEVVGTATIELNKADYQSPLGNFMVDLQKEQSQPLYGKPIDLSLMTNGGMRSPLPKGAINVGHVFELMPFENEVVVLTLDGATVQELFDFAAKAKIAILGNATYTVKNGQATAISIGGKPFDAAKSYTLVTSDYLANGGDNLSFLSKATSTENVGLLLRDAILQQIRQLTAAGKPIEPDTKTRVTILP